MIDTCGYVPRIVRASAELLQDAVGVYLFISTLSVFADSSQAGLTEDAPLATLENESLEEITGESYGPLKVLCEQAVQQAYPGRALIIRPGLVVGPHDHTDRFTYWPYRLSLAGEVAAPAPSVQPVQFIDGRDLAQWAIQLLETGIMGVLNATGPRDRTTLGGLLTAAAEPSGHQPHVTWLPADFLMDLGVEPWRELPLWLPGEDTAGLFQFDISKALSQGLRLRPMSETLGDTLQWARTRPRDHDWQAGLSRKREAQLLAAWKAGN